MPAPNSRHYAECIKRRRRQASTGAAADGAAAPQPPPATLPFSTASPSDACQLQDEAHQTRERREHPYRLADLLGSRFFRHTSGGVHFHLRHYPNSLAAAYICEYDHVAPLWHRYNLGGVCARNGARAPSDFCKATRACPCHVPAAAAIVHLFVREAVQDAALRVPTHTAAVHLRVGDVIDLSPHPLETILSRTTSFASECGAKLQTSAGGRFCAGIPDKLYALPLAAYESVAAELRQQRVRRVVILGASHTNQSSSAKSCAYVRRVGDFFRARGFEVGFRLGQSADDDLRFMAHSSHLVPSGASGFSQLTAAVASLMGAQMVYPRLAGGRDGARVKEAFMRNGFELSGQHLAQMCRMVGCEQNASASVLPRACITRAGAACE